jgi:genome maintenance exonuclease 1|tara:strand:+ start:628 stop:1317 length:690 start_codon:yes stop_codon:yes gene_type:complete
MVDLIPIRKLYQYASLQRQDLPEGRRYIYGEQKLPSVTTILSATKKDKGALDAWVARVGQEEADRIKNEAGLVGTYLHEVIERMVAYRHLPRPTNWEMCKGYELGYKIINTYFRNVSEIWGSEVSLYYPEKYAGTTDLVGVYRDKPAIIDFKQSNKPKRREWIEDYFCQLAAYALAHDKIHDTNIDNAVVLMAVRSDGSTAEFSTAGREFQGYKDLWMRRVEDFHKTQS